MSVSAAAGPANGDSVDVTLSADGRFVAFGSLASNLVAGDSNGNEDVFVRDRSGGTTRVSVASGGQQGNGRSYRPSLSADGRYVAFVSEATNLVPGDSNGVKDVFVHDRATATTIRVSVAPGGGQGNGASFDAAISGDGRSVAFASLARNLTPGDANGVHDIFVHDRTTGTTVRINDAAGGGDANRESEKPSLSHDGRYVTYSSSASNLVAGDSNGARDIFVYDRITGQTTRVSVASGGGQQNGDSGFVPSISADGRYVAFMSDASNLVAGDRNGVRDIFVHDRAASSTTRVSVSSAGREGNDDAFYAPSISGNGAVVAFVSEASNLVAGDTNGARDVFLHNRATGTTTRVNLAPDGSQAKGGTLGAPSVSGDGGLVAFQSAASNLAQGDRNGADDVYVHGVGVQQAALAQISTGPGGYRLVGSDGGIFTFGDAKFHGSTGAIRLARPIVGMAPTPSGKGYWLVASDGGIFAFGDAKFHGSTGAIRLARPIVGMAPTPSGKGYWLVASDGGIFTFGDAKFHGSTGAVRLARPIVGMAATPKGKGYWLVASDGGIFNFGDGGFHGSTGAVRLARPIVAMAG